MKVYEKIANLVNWNPIDDKWIDYREDLIEFVERNILPSGSGFDSGTTIDLDNSNDKKITFITSFHHLNENGFYDGWTEHKVIIRPTFYGIDIKVTGKDRNDIKDYIGEMFSHVLNDDFDQYNEQVMKLVGRRCAKHLA